MIFDDENLHQVPSSVFNGVTENLDPFPRLFSSISPRTGRAAFAEMNNTKSAG